VRARSRVRSGRARATRGARSGDPGLAA
jgi:hypothetical protein